MGKKIDLNKPRNNNNVGTKNHHFSHYNNQQTPNKSTDEDSGNNLERKLANKGLKAAGVPKIAADFITENEIEVNFED